MVVDARVTRRGLLGGFGVTVVAGIAGYAVAHGSSYADRKRATTAANSGGYGGTTARKQLAKLSSVPMGGGIVLSKADVVITREPNGDVHAFSATCTHQGCQVTGVSDGQIICPCHGSKFAATNGHPTAGPARRPLPTVNVTVEGDAIYVG
jgi:Rieske Fe-S protein